jgi:hypothetical protein
LRGGAAGKIGASWVAFVCIHRGWGEGCSIAERANHQEDVAVTVRKIFATALGVCLGASAGVSQGQEGVSPIPSVVPTNNTQQLQAAHSLNQRVADSVSQTLRQSGQLRNYRIDVSCADGVVDLTGLVASAQQRDAALRLAQGTPGVRQVREQLRVSEPGSIVAVQAQPMPPFGQPGAGGFVPPPPTGIGQPPQGFPPLPNPAPGNGQDPAPIFQAPPGAPPGMPVGPGGPGMGAMQQPPPMPPYAWPSVAPYNNASRVAYQNLYPYEAVPFIGPFYPFPKVPLGWRSVTLSWEDGHWWYGPSASGHDWWRVRYR